MNKSKEFNIKNKNNENKIITKLFYKLKEFFIKYKMYLLCIVILTLSIISIVIQSIDKKNTMQVNFTKINKKDEKIAVYITGAVKNPGVYYLEENSRLISLLDICGGINENADIEHINLAKKLVDSDKINIPEKKEKNYEDNDDDNNYDSVMEESEDNIENNTNEKININNASKEKLMKLNGIGSSTADKIIEYRKSQKFLEIEDIMNVSGIGKSKFEKIKDDIVVD